MKRNCIVCKNSFNITPSDYAWLKKHTQKSLNKSFELPEPTLCPRCRLQRRASFRNDQFYYRNNCLLCNQSLISIYSPDKQIPILCEGCYWGDNWNALDYGKDFDPNRPFFEQFAEMKSLVPRLAIFNTQSENSRYTVHSSRNKDCYMSSSLCDCEETLYSDLCVNIKKSAELFSCEQMELCYECSYCEACYDCEYLVHCYGLTESCLCYDCRGSSQLLGCVGIRRGENQILNRPVTKDHFLETLNQFKQDARFREEFLKKFEILRLQAYLPARWTNNIENSNGDNLTQCKNIEVGFNLKFSEDVRFGFEGNRLRDCLDVFRGANGEMLYECTAIVDCKFSAFCNLTYQASSMLYCDNCQSGCQDCFGCMGLKKEQYCILNKKYSKDEYYSLLPQIVERMKSNNEWGEFFPIQLSPFGYNETRAAELFPLDRSEVIKQGWKWSDFDAGLPTGIKSIAANLLPHSSDSRAEETLDCAIICEVSGKPFRIVKPELEFYRQKNLPLPKKGAPQRRLERSQKQNPMQLWRRKCVDCECDVSTSYSPSSKEKVCCESCYLKRAY